MLEPRLTADQLDREPAAMMACSLTEVKWVFSLGMPSSVAVFTLLIGWPIAALTPLDTVHTLMIAFTVGCCLSWGPPLALVWWISKNKRDKPIGYYNQRFKQSWLYRCVRPSPFMTAKRLGNYRYD